VASGQPADLALRLESYTSPEDRQRLAWPWGVWTDGTKLAAVATHGGAILVWNTWPTRDDQQPDLILRPTNAGTPRNITSDGTFLMVGDHNYKGARRPGPVPQGNQPPQRGGGGIPRRSWHHGLEHLARQLRSAAGLRPAGMVQGHDHARRWVGPRGNPIHFHLEQTSARCRHSSLGSPDAPELPQRRWARRRHRGRPSLRLQLQRLQHPRLEHDPHRPEHSARFRPRQCAPRRGRLGQTLLHPESDRRHRRHQPLCEQRFRPQALRLETLARRERRRPGSRLPFAARPVG